MTDIETMNIEQVRDEASERLWGKPRRWCGVMTYNKPKEHIGIGPYTLDGIAALWPKEWKWERFLMEDTNVVWEARRFVDGAATGRVTLFDTGNELHDRTRLLLAVLREKA